MQMIHRCSIFVAHSDASMSRIYCRRANSVTDIRFGSMLYVKIRY